MTKVVRAAHDGIAERGEGALDRVAEEVDEAAAEHLRLHPRQRAPSRGSARSRRTRPGATAARWTLNSVCVGVAPRSLLASISESSIAVIAVKTGSTIIRKVAEDHAEMDRPFGVEDPFERAGW